MIYHVLPGDAQVDSFKKADIDGKLVVFRECFIVGPIDADNDLFWDERAQFLLAEYGEDEIAYRDQVERELIVLEETEPGDEINLWFEYELFCSVNLWFCLSQLNGADAKVYRVSPSIRERDERWKGFGGLDGDDLERCFEDRVLMTSEQVALGAELWKAYSLRDNELLAELKDRDEASAFPYIDEVIDAAIDIDTRPSEILAEIQFEGKNEFGEVFAEFSKRAGVYGLGDLQVERMLERA